MQLIAHGVDLVKVQRIAEMLRDHGDQFLKRCFTAAEAEYSISMPRRKAEHLAARFAAKEAVMKALGTGLTGGISWTDIEVSRDGSGRPGLRLSGVALQHAQRLGISSWLISLSHTDDHAMASVIAVA